MKIKLDMEFEAQNKEELGRTLGDVFQAVGESLDMKDREIHIRESGGHRRVGRTSVSGFPRVGGNPLSGGKEG